MSQYHKEIHELKTDLDHWDYARGKAAQLKLEFKSKLASMRREKEIQIQAERERNYKDGSCIRYDALRSAAYAAKAGVL